MNRTITCSESNPTVEEYLMLRELVGWVAMPESVVAASLDAHLYCVTARTTASGSIVGMARVVGDGGLCFYIQDVIVHPDYQRRGIGKTLMEHVLNYIDRTACRNSYVGLMAAKDRAGFYAAYGFETRPNEHLGPGMTMFWGRRPGDRKEI